jgi:hypothetical protein
LNQAHATSLLKCCVLIIHNAGFFAGHRLHSL